MDGEIAIKQEPIDYMDEDVVEQDDIKLESDIKIEYEGPSDEAQNAEEVEPFKIVEEGSGVITISAADLKSEDEKNFLRRINLLLVNGKAFEDKHCMTLIPNMKIKEEPSEDNNIPTKDRTCSFCKRTFLNVNLLVEHMSNEHRSLKEFVCSACRRSFQSFDHLSKHWSTTNHACTMPVNNRSYLKGSKIDGTACSTPLPLRVKTEPGTEMETAVLDTETKVELDHKRSKQRQDCQRENNPARRGSENIEIIELTSSKYPAHVRNEVLSSDMGNSEDESTASSRCSQDSITSLSQSAESPQSPQSQSSLSDMQTQRKQVLVNADPSKNRFILPAKPTDIIETLKDGNRKVILSKPVLNVIENIPEKRALIRNIQEQIKNVASCQTECIPAGAQDPQQCPIVLKEIKTVVAQDAETLIPIKILSKPTAEVQAPAVESLDTLSETGTEVPTLYLTLETKFDPELARVRFSHPDHRFQWECPRCQRLYEHKYTFRNHLVNVHEMPTTELVTLVFKIKASKQIIKQDVSDTSKVISSSEAASAKRRSDNRTSLEAKAPKQKYKYSCPKCQRICSSKVMLTDHIKANCGREPQYGCHVCSKKFFSASTLNCHMTIHTGELPHKCSYCEKRFRTRGQVTVHHRTHTGERPFACQICNQSFTHRETLISHLSRHIGMKRYKCYGCEKQFSSISGLKMHREIRPDTCGKVKFNSRALGPRVRVVQGTVIFEPQPAINPYLRTEDPQVALAEVQNTMTA